MNDLAPSNGLSTSYGMDAAAKLFRYLAENGISDADFAATTKVPKSFLSNLRSGKVRLRTVTQGQRIARGMGVGLDYLFDEAQGWPPPRAMDRAPLLSEAERELLDFARKLCMGDPGLTDALDRIYMRGPYRPVTTTPTDLQPPPGRSHGETKNGPGRKPPGPKT